MRFLRRCVLAAKFTKPLHCRANVAGKEVDADLKSITGKQATISIDMLGAQKGDAVSLTILLVGMGAVGKVSGKVISVKGRDLTVAVSDLDDKTRRWIDALPAMQGQRLVP